MKTPLLALTIVIGAVLAVHLAMNSKVSGAINNPRVANMLFWCIGASGAVLVGITGWQAGALAPVKQVNPLLLTAGLLGFSITFIIAWLIPRVGASSVMISLIAGQVIGGMVLSQYGLLGSPVQRVSVANIVGAAVMLAGVALATRTT